MKLLRGCWAVPRSTPVPVTVGYAPRRLAKAFVLPPRDLAWTTSISIGMDIARGASQCPGCRDPLEVGRAIQSARAPDVCPIFPEAPSMFASTEAIARSANTLACAHMLPDAFS